MQPVSFKRHRFPPSVIRHFAWLYFWFTLSFGDKEKMLTQRGIEVSYETIHRWTVKFGELFAQINSERLDNAGRSNRCLYVGGSSPPAM